MRVILHSRSLYVLGAAVLIGIALLLIVKTLTANKEERVVGTVVRGNVHEIVSVSGVIEAENAAELAFPVNDIVATVNVKEGDAVNAGEVLATLSQADLLAERQDALAALEIAEADRDELLAGPSTEERAVTDTNVLIAEDSLARTIVEEDEKVKNALRTLRSSDLAAIPVDKDDNETPPIITGTYTCDSEGEYVLKPFSSGAKSGESYYFEGLESGLSVAFTEAAAPLGNCGLKVKFTDGEHYGNTEWIVAIPNPDGASYTTNLNAYELAVKQRDARVEAAEQALDLALTEQSLENATPRTEALRRANATVMQASARLQGVEAKIEDRTLTAPFPGTVTNVDILPGETSGTQPVVTIVADDLFELTARIPEIDITKITIGQRTEVVFDARSSEVIRGVVTFISPIATEIDGVAYFEAKLGFDETPSWLRSGLNADVDIIVDERNDTLVILKRFLIEEDGTYYVLVGNENDSVKTNVERGFVGNDGFVEITGLEEGDQIVAP